MLENKQESMKNCFELRECLEILAGEVFRGYHFLGIFKRLNETKQKFPEVNQEFSYLIDGLEDATLESSYFYLFKVLEYTDLTSSKNRPVTFRYFLSLALKNLECFSFTEKSKLRKIINSDLNWVSPKNNEKIQHLKYLRNKTLAHIDRERLSSSDADKIKFIFKYEERDPAFVNELYRELGQKLNEYNEMLNEVQLGIFSDELFLLKEEEKLFSLIAKGIIT
jgi:hypothetical protein